jgi:hypothetical protein
MRARGGTLGVQRRGADSNHSWGLLPPPNRSAPAPHLLRSYPPASRGSPPRPPERVFQLTSFRPRPSIRQRQQPDLGEPQEYLCCCCLAPSAARGSPSRSPFLRSPPSVS